MIKYPGYDEAVVGPAYVRIDKQMVNVLVYDAEKIRDILVKRDGMSHEEAREYIEFNIEGGYLGPETPILVWPDDIWDEGDYDRQRAACK